MFGMGFTEIFLIGVVAIIALGPDKVPTVMVQIAKFFKQVKTQVSDAKETIENEIRLSELKDEASSIKEKLENSVSDIKSNTIGIDLDTITEDFESIKSSVSKPSKPKEQYPKNRYISDKNIEIHDEKAENV